MDELCLSYAVLITCVGKAGPHRFWNSFRGLSQRNTCDPIPHTCPVTPHSFHHHHHHHPGCTGLGSSANRSRSSMDLKLTGSGRCLETAAAAAAHNCSRSVSLSPSPQQLFGVLVEYSCLIFLFEIENLPEIWLTQNYPPPCFRLLCGLSLVQNILTPKVAKTWGAVNIAVYFQLFNYLYLSCMGTKAKLTT